MTGLAVLEKLKSSAKTMMIPVIVMSGNSDPQLPKTVNEIGGDEFLLKPIDIEKLRRTLYKLLGKSLDQALDGS